MTMALRVSLLVVAGAFANGVNGAAFFPFAWTSEDGNTQQAGLLLSADAFTNVCFNFILDSVGKPADFDADSFAANVVSACRYSDTGHCQEWAHDLRASVSRKLHDVGTQQFDTDSTIASGGSLSYSAWCQKVYDFQNAAMMVTSVTRQQLSDAAAIVASVASPINQTSAKAAMTSVSFPFSFSDEFGDHKAGIRLMSDDFAKMCYNFILTTAEQPNLNSDTFTRSVVSSCWHPAADMCDQWAHDLWGCVSRKIMDYDTHKLDFDKAIGVDGSMSYGTWCRRVYDAQNAHSLPAAVATQATADVSSADADSDVVVVLMQAKRSLRKGRVPRGA
jgi:hypothetical protein